MCIFQHKSFSGIESYTNNSSVVAAAQWQRSQRLLQNLLLNTTSAWDLEAFNILSKSQRNLHDVDVGFFKAKPELLLSRVQKSLSYHGRKHRGGQLHQSPSFTKSHTSEVAPKNSEAYNGTLQLYHNHTAENYLKI